MNMSPEYMAELHKFLYLSDDSDIERLKAVVSTHLLVCNVGTYRRHSNLERIYKIISFGRNIL